MGQQGQLSGCHNDVAAMKGFVMTHGGFTEDAEGCRVLMDDGHHTPPTSRNIMEAMHWLVAGAQAGDDLFMHYSGHGGSMPVIQMRPYSFYTLT